MAGTYTSIPALPENLFFIPSQIFFPPKHRMPTNISLPGMPNQVNPVYNKIFNLCWNTGTCLASHSFLANGLSKSPVSNRRYVKELYDNKFIDKKHHFKAPNTYHLMLNEKIIQAALNAGYTLNIDELKKLILKQNPNFEFDQIQNQQRTESLQHQIQDNLFEQLTNLIKIAASILQSIQSKTAAGQIDQNETFSNFIDNLTNLIKTAASMLQSLQSNAAGEQNTQGEKSETASSEGEVGKDTQGEKSETASSEGEAGKDTQGEKSETASSEGEVGKDTQGEKSETASSEGEAGKDTQGEKSETASSEGEVGKDTQGKKSKTESTANPPKEKQFKPNSRFTNRFNRNMEQVEEQNVSFSSENAKSVKTATDEEIDVAFEKLWASYPKDRVDDGDYKLCKKLFREMCRQGRIPNFSIFFRYLEQCKTTYQWRVTNIENGTHQYAPTLRNFLIKQEWGTKVDKIASQIQAQEQAQAKKITEIAKEKQLDEQRKNEVQAKQEFFRNNKNTIEAINENLAQKFDFVHLNITTSLVYSTIQNCKCSLMQILDKATSVTKGQFSNLGKFFENLKVATA